MLEMYRRDRLRPELLDDQCAEVVSLEARLQEIDSLLTATRQPVQATRCVCGAPLIWGSHFCPNCGRPAGEAVVQCANCGHAIAADARFCVQCGSAVAPAGDPVSAEPYEPEPEPSAPSASESWDAPPGAPAGAERRGEAEEADGAPESAGR